jgi:hypothetical protein
MARKAKPKADSGWSDIDGGSAFVIPYTLLRHANFLRLSAKACKILLDLGRQYSGFNNGYLSAALSIMKPMGWRSESTIREAIDECLHYRLIEKTRQGGRNKCNLFAVTWRRINEKSGKSLDVAPTMAPSNAWKVEMVAFKKPSRKRSRIPRHGSNMPPLRVVS